MHAVDFADRRAGRPPSQWIGAGVPATDDLGQVKTRGRGQLSVWPQNHGHMIVLAARFVVLGTLTS
jgi:hypothetical protein